MFLQLHCYVFPLELKRKHKIVYIVIILFTDREIEAGGVICPQLPPRLKAGLGIESITPRISVLCNLLGTVIPVSLIYNFDLTPELSLSCLSDMSFILKAVLNYCFPSQTIVHTSQTGSGNALDSEL